MLRKGHSADPEPPETRGKEEVSGRPRTRNRSPETGLENKGPEKREKRLTVPFFRLKMLCRKPLPASERIKTARRSVR